MRDEYNAEDRRNLKDLRLQLQSLQDYDEPTLSITYRVDDADYSIFSAATLVAQREAHQTRHAAHAVRTSLLSSSSQTSSNPQMSLRRQLLNTYYENLREEQAQGITTAEGRKIRWTKQNATGNALNAAVVAGNEAKTVSAIRTITC
jgi:hypothetical protein